MPPSNKGMKKKAERKDSSRPPRSRNTTPSAGGPAAPSTPYETALLGARIKPLTGHNFEELTDANNASIPDSKSLRDVAEQLRSLSSSVEANALELDAGMRKLANVRKEKAREMEEEKRTEDMREAIKIRDEQEKARKAASKKKETVKPKEDRPLAHGAHGVAAQDGSSMGKVRFSTSYIATFVLWRTACPPSFLRVPRGLA